jgi:hypothetical protein
MSIKKRIFEIEKYLKKKSREPSLILISNAVKDDSQVIGIRVVEKTYMVVNGDSLSDSKERILKEEKSEVIIGVLIYC